MFQRCVLPSSSVVKQFSKFHSVHVPSHTRRSYPHNMFYLEFIKWKLKTWVVNESVGVMECEWAHSTTVVRHCMANRWVVKTSHPCHLIDLMSVHFCYSLKWKPPLNDKCSSFGCNGWLFLDVFKRYKKAAKMVYSIPRYSLLSFTF
jgi:hypothetical protein